VRSNNVMWCSIPSISIIRRGQSTISPRNNYFMLSFDGFFPRRRYEPNDSNSVLMPGVCVMCDECPMVNGDANRT